MTDPSVQLFIMLNVYNLLRVIARHPIRTVKDLRSDRHVVEHNV